MQEKIPKISFRPSARKLSFELINLRELLARIGTPKDHHPNKPHRVDFFIIMVITAGTGKHYVDFQSYGLKARDVLVISKGQVHAFDPPSTFDGYLLLFTEEFLLEYFSPNTLQLVSRLYNYHISSPYFPQVPFSGEVLSQIREEMSQGMHFGRSNMIAAMLTMFMLRLERSVQGYSQELFHLRHYELFNEFQEGVKRHFSQTRNGIYYAKELGISYKLLNQVCKAFTSKTVKQFVDDYVILEAKRNLIATSLSIKEISYLCGFDETTNFAKFFKKHTTYTPLRFRESVLVT